MGNASSSLSSAVGRLQHSAPLVSTMHPVSAQLIGGSQLSGRSCTHCAGQYSSQRAVPRNSSFLHTANHALSDRCAANAGSYGYGGHSLPSCRVAAIAVGTCKAAAVSLYAGLCVRNRESARATPRMPYGSSTADKPGAAAHKQPGLSGPAAQGAAATLNEPWMPRKATAARCGTSRVSTSCPQF